MTATYIPVGCLPLEHTQAGWLLGEHPLRMLQMGATETYPKGNLQLRGVQKLQHRTSLRIGLRRRVRCCAMRGRREGAVTDVRRVWSQDERLVA